MSLNHYRKQAALVGVLVMDKSVLPVWTTIIVSLVFFWSAVGLILLS